MQNAVPKVMTIVTYNCLSKHPKLKSDPTTAGGYLNLQER